MATFRKRTDFDARHDRKNAVRSKEDIWSTASSLSTTKRADHVIE
jgi:hypothetical protein